MQPFANFALAASILTCALGAITLCLLVYRHGFGEVTESASEAALHRAYVTRLGHLAGAVCFAVAAGFTTVALGVQWRAPVTPPSVPEATSTDVAREFEQRERLERLERMRADHAALTERLRIVGERLHGAEATIERLRSEQGRLVARLGDVETLSRRPGDAERLARPRPAPAATASPRPATPTTTPARTPTPPAPAPSASSATRVSPKPSPAADPTWGSSRVAPRPSSSATAPAASPTSGSSVVTSPLRSSPVTPPTAVSPAAARPPSAATAPTAPPTSVSSPVASPQPASAISGKPVDTGSPRSAPEGSGRSASEPEGDFVVPPESARGEGGPTSRGPMDSVRGNQDIFVQAQRAMDSAGGTVTRHVGRFAKDVKDAVLQFGRNVRSGFE
jgi:hypothetical protein